MASFTVDGVRVDVEGRRRLIRFLRDDLRITGVKDGCSEGACGACQVLVDGRPMRACVLWTDKLEGKSVVTIAGLSAFEKAAYAYAFGACGAVQCGFCAPGMVISAKGLLDRVPDPTREEVARALRGNICRCTGYVKIVDAVLLAAKILREGRVPPVPDDYRLGTRAHRIDAAEKVLGTGIYADDVYAEGMIHASAVRSAYPRARVLAIHTEEAEALPGVVGVFTAADVPGENKVGHLVHDWDTMIPVGGVTHYLGDAICLVAAETPEILDRARALIRVEYEELPMIRSPREAMVPGAPTVHRSGALLAHRHIQRGDPARAIAKSRYVLTERFSTPWTEHAFLEPECAVAWPDRTEDGRPAVRVLSSDQSVYDTQREIMRMMGWEADQVRVRNALVGGGFGGKEDVTVQHHAALIAHRTGRPVKVKLSRAESLLVHPKRHPMEIELSMGCDGDGIIQGVAAEVIADTGAYASLGGPVLERACTHAAGPYHYQNFEIDGWAWYTNDPPAGAFRGFGVTQTCFAVESLLDRMADLVGISPWEIRYRNAVRPGQELPNGQIAGPETGLVETLEAVRPYIEGRKYVGLACAMKNSGVGVGIPDYGRVRLTVEDGRIHIRAGASCIGQGLGTVLTRMVCEQTGIGADRIVYERADTADSPDAGTTSGSRQTLFTGEACRRACQDLMAALGDRPLSDLDGREFRGEYLGVTDPLGADVPHPVSHVAYGFATQACILDEDGRIERIVAAHDVGRAVDPLSVEGQIEGGVVMSMGYALTERYPLKDCRPTAKFGTLGLLRADQIPEIVPIIVEKPGLDLACGAIGIGEITSIPTAPAIADAYFRYDGRFRRSLPLEGTPYSRK